MLFEFFIRSLQETRKRIFKWCTAVVLEYGCVTRSPSYMFRRHDSAFDYLLPSSSRLIE